MASIATDSGNRDSYFRNTAMRAAKFPTATFELTEPVVADGVPQPGVAQKVSAKGETWPTASFPATELAPQKSVVRSRRR